MAPSLTLSSFFPIAASQTCEGVPDGGYGPKRPPRGGRSGKWEDRVVCLGLQELGMSRKCCKAGLKRSRSSLLSELGLVTEVWLGVSGVGAGGRGEIVSEDLGVPPSFLFKQQQANWQARLEQVAHTSVYHGNRAFVPLPHLDLCPTSQGWRCHLRMCHDVPHSMCVLTENVCAHFMPLYRNSANGKQSFFSLLPFCHYFFTKKNIVVLL